MNKIILITATILTTAFAKAQNFSKSFVSTGLSIGNFDQLTLANIPVSYNHQVKGLNGLRYILGIRQNLAFGQSTYTINNQQTTIDDISSYSVNVMFGFEYISKRKLLFGFTIDALGVNTGTRSFKTIGTDPIYKINPEYTNILLGASNDRGTLNSEFYLGYRLSEFISLKAGLAHYLITLEYSNINGKGCVQSFSNIPFVQLQYSLWQN
ncbi:hypothetical protein AEM51_06630 [Bacteroidetes bacterium UKL13-3]|jgi:hypothetical protein|nr:hypothetical protein AEM51_06630 [Bacteroidetes bacterium UKL13-3]HCP93410.1 hypothetical protein [Bacteroidota bacterium]